MGAHPYGAYADVTAQYAGMLARDYEGNPWRGYGAPLYPGAPPAVAVAPAPGMTVVDQIAAVKRADAAQVATAEIAKLPGGAIGEPRPLIISGAAMFGDAAIVGALLVASTDVLVHTYTVQPGYKVILDNEDPLQMVAIRPYDNTTAGAYIDCMCKVDVAEAATGDGNTVFLGPTIAWRPDQQWAAGDRFRSRWNKKWTAEGNDLIRTWLRLNATQAAQTVNNATTRLHHVVRCWKVLG